MLSLSFFLSKRTDLVLFGKIIQKISEYNLMQKQFSTAKLSFIRNIYCCVTSKLTVTKLNLPSTLIVISSRLTPCYKVFCQSETLTIFSSFILNCACSDLSCLPKEMKKLKPQKMFFFIFFPKKASSRIFEGEAVCGLFRRADQPPPPPHPQTPALGGAMNPKRTPKLW